MDLALTDLGTDVATKVLPQVAEHNAVLVKLTLPVPRTVLEKREQWLYDKADWDGLRKALREANWDEEVFSSVCENSVNECVERFTELVLSTARRFIPVKSFSCTRFTHP